MISSFVRAFLSLCLLPALSACNTDVAETPGGIENAISLSAANESSPVEEQPLAVAFHAQQLNPASSYGRLVYQRHSAFVVYIHPDALLDFQEHITAVQVSEEDPDRFGVSFQLTPSGLNDVQALSEGSEAGGDHPIHLLVRGEVVREYKVRDFLEGPIAMATGLSREVADEYMAALTH